MMDYLATDDPDRSINNHYCWLQQGRARICDSEYHDLTFGFHSWTHPHSYQELTEQAQLMPYDDCAKNVDHLLRVRIRHRLAYMCSLGECTRTARYAIGFACNVCHTVTYNYATCSTHMALALTNRRTNGWCGFTNH